VFITHPISAVLLLAAVLSLIWPLLTRLLHREHPASVPSTMVARRRFFDRIGLFDTTYHASDDLDWMLRARDLGTPMAMLPDCLLLRRVHQANMSSRSAPMLREVGRALKASLDRRRASRRHRMTRSRPD
jgi:GT2 family glycosyltransferase